MATPEYYFASNRLGSVMPRISTVTETSTVGTPARFDAAVVGSCIQLPSVGGLTISCRFHMDAVLGYVQEFYLHFEARSEAANWQAGVWIEVRTNTGLPVLQVIRQTGPALHDVYEIQVWTGAAWSKLTGSFIPPQSLTSYDMYIKGGVAGEFALSIGGVPEMSASFNSVHVSNLAEVRFSCRSGYTAYMSQIMASNFDMRSTKLSSDIANANGAENDGSGSFTDVSTIPHDALTARTLPADGNKFTMPKAARTLPGNYEIDAVVVNGSLRVFGGVVANARPVIRIGGVNYSGSDVVPGISSGYEARGGYWTISPATSLRFSITEFNALQFGWEAKT